MPKLFLGCILIALIAGAFCSTKQEFTLYSDYNTPIDLLFSSPPNEIKLSIAPNSHISLSNSEEEILKYNPSEETLESAYSTKTGSDVIVQNDLMFYDTKQWKLYHIEDFQGTAEGWSHNTLSTCGSSTDLFLGELLALLILK